VPVSNRLPVCRVPAAVSPVTAAATPVRAHSGDP